MDEDLAKIMEEEECQIQESFPEGSFQKIFWDQQKQAMKQKDMRGIRWYPLMIRFCLYLRHQSGKAYEALRQSGCVMLPSQRTLRDYSHAVETVVGFSWEKFAVVLIDEMYNREDLAYEKNTGTLIGFVNLGEINNHLLAFERSLDQDSDVVTGCLAKTVVTFMVRGIFTSLRYPYAHFF